MRIIRRPIIFFRFNYKQHLLAIIICSISTNTIIIIIINIFNALFHNNNDNKSNSNDQNDDKNLMLISYYYTDIKKVSFSVTIGLGLKSLVRPIIQLVFSPF